MHLFVMFLRSITDQKQSTDVVCIFPFVEIKSLQLFLSVKTDRQNERLLFHTIHVVTSHQKTIIPNTKPTNKHILFKAEHN